jgi:hypothetical protein
MVIKLSRSSVSRDPFESGFTVHCNKWYQSHVRKRKSYGAAMDMFHEAQGLHGWSGEGHGETLKTLSEWLEPSNEMQLTG